MTFQDFEFFSKIYCNSKSPNFLESKGNKLLKEINQIFLYYEVKTSGEFFQILWPSHDDLILVLKSVFSKKAAKIDEI